MTAIASVIAMVPFVFLDMKPLLPNDFLYYGQLYKFSQASFLFLKFHKK